ncbi:MAG: GNAT family N-acetyltransferase [Gammaproteobacteria bacterium]|jgi:ribosomal protein S18 acetylase RimI-like enzyme
MRLYPPEVSFVAPDAELGSRLRPIARRIFSETFGHLYDGDALRTFCDGYYGIDGPMANDLADPSVGWRIAVVDNRPIGYAKLTPLRAPATNAPDGSLELQQIYVLSQWHGQGVADELMNWAIGSARSAGAPELYLTVFSHNERAKRFYTRYGFDEVGRCTFVLGDYRDDDRIWRKVL